MKSTLPNGWIWVKLGEVLHTTSGGTPSRREARYYNGNIPWVKSGELDKGLITDTEEKITEEAVRNSSAKIFPKGTLLIALYGATIGKLAFLGVDAATNQAICGIFKSENVNSNFLYHYLFYKRQKLINQGIGGAQPNISQTILKDLDIPLPPKSTQESIVSKLDELFSELDKGIENLNTSLRELKIYRQIILQLAYEGKLTNENVKVGELPKNWTLTKLGEYIEDISSGKSFRCDERPPNKDEVGIVKVSSVTWGFFDEMESKTCFSTSFLNTKHLIRKNDFLFSRANTIELIGACVIVHKIERTLMLSDKILRFTFSKNVLKEYVLYYLRSRTGRREIESLSTGNQESMRNIGQDKIRQIEFPYCSIEEQQIVVKTIENRLSVIDKVEESIKERLQQSETLRQSILKKAFEGNLVESSSNNESANELLEKIKKEKKDLLENEKLRNDNNRKITVMNKTSQKSTPTLKNIISEKFSTKEFTFNELNEIVEWKYDEIRDELYKLLDESKSLKMNFNKADEVMKFKYTGK